MDLRIFTEPQQGASYADQLRVAQAAEELGFDAFFRSDHYLSMGSASGLPGPTDAWVTLAGLARETSHIRLGTLVSPVTFRLPGPLAITVAQVDEMSGGRVELGLGAGWYAAEHTAYGMPFPEVGERFSQLVEQVEIVHGLFSTPTGGRFDYAGTYYTLEGSPALPKPVQLPHPPIVLGGAARKRGAALAAKYADEFNAGFDSLEDTRAIFGRVREAAEETGRELTYSIAHTTVVGKDEAQLKQRAEAIGRDVENLRANSVAGTPAEVIDRLGAFAELGATRGYLQILDLGDIEHLELIAAEVLPHV